MKYSDVWPMGRGDPIDGTGLSERRRPMGTGMRKLRIIGLCVLFLLAFYAVGITMFLIGRRMAGPGVSQITVSTAVQEIPVFRVESFQVSSSQFSRLSEEKDWWRGGGTYTMIYTFDAVVVFGVDDPGSVEVSREDDVITVKLDSVGVSVLHSYVKNQRFLGGSQTSVFGPQTITFDVLFNTLISDAESAALIATTEENMERALLSFMEGYERICGALGLTVVWE